MANVEDNLKEFDKIDPAADGFRYPLNSDRTLRSMPDAPEHVNLRVLHEAMEAVANFLSSVRSELGARLEYIAQMEAEQMEAERSCSDERE